MVSLKQYSNYVYLFILVLSIYVAFLLVKPFLVAILSAVVVAYVFSPWYKGIHKKIKNKNLAALVTTIIVLLLITIPLILVINAVTREVYLFYTISKEKIATGQILAAECNDSGSICHLVNYIKGKLSEPRVGMYLQNAVNKFSAYIIDGASKLPSRIAVIALNIFIVIFATFFLLRDGEDLAKKIGNFIPIKKSHQKRVMKKFDDVTYAIIYGTIITALVQGAVGALGFFIFGIRSPLVWGLVMVLAALIPLVGPPIIWIPAGLSLILNGYIGGESWLIIKGIGLLLYGAFVISSIDNFVKPKIIGGRARVHPLIVVLGVFGGFKMFGLIGFVIGPLVLALCLTFLKICQQRTIQ